MYSKFSVLFNREIAGQKTVPVAMFSSVIILNLPVNQHQLSTFTINSALGVQPEVFTTEYFFLSLASFLSDVFHLAYRVYNALILAPF